jgi:hypothetical protein
MKEILYMSNNQLLLQPTVQDVLPVLHPLDFNHQKNIESLNRRTQFLSHVKEDFGNLSIEEEAKRIRMAYFQNEAVNRNLVEIRTKNWVNLGRMLNIHRKGVEAAGRQWSVWAVDHFPFLKQRRREMAMELANFGSKVEHYLYMGMDRLYDLFHKLKKYHGEPEFQLIANRFGYLFKIQPETEETKVEMNKNADKIREFFRFKEQMKNNSFDRDLLLDVIEAGGKFEKKDYEEINKLTSSNPQGVNEFLRSTLCNGGTPKGRSTKPAAKDSIQIILAMLIETIDKFEVLNTYPPLNKSLFKAAKDRMLKLEIHI